LFILPNLRV